MAIEQRKSVAIRIALIARLVRIHFDRRARAFGLTNAQWYALGAIARDVGATQRRIAERLGVGDVTAGRLIERLAEIGLIERLSDPMDRRAWRLHVTQAGEALLDTLAPIGLEEERKLVAGLSADQVSQLYDMLDVVIRNLAKAGFAGAEDIPGEMEGAGEA